MDLNTAVGHTLRRVRESQKLTLRQVSKSSCVSLGHISAIETASRAPSLFVVEQLWTKGLDMEISELMKQVYITIKENK